MSQKKGRPAAGSELFWMLYRAGPMTTEEAGTNPTVDDRRLYDVRTFGPLNRFDPVLYLGQYHSERTVLRRWLAENFESLKRADISIRALTYDIPNEFLPAWRVIRDDDRYDPLRNNPKNGGAQESDGHTCTKCGTEDIYNLPRHMRNCNG